MQKRGVKLFQPRLVIQCQDCETKIGVQEIFGDRQSAGRFWKRVDA